MKILKPRSTPSVTYHFNSRSHIRITRSRFSWVEILWNGFYSTMYNDLLGSSYIVRPLSFESALCRCVYLCLLHDRRALAFGRKGHKGRLRGQALAEDRLRRQQPRANHHPRKRPRIPLSSPSRAWPRWCASRHCTPTPDGTTHAQQRHVQQRQRLLMSTQQIPKIGLCSSWR